MSENLLHNLQLGFYLVYVKDTGTKYFFKPVKVQSFAISVL